MRDLVCILTCTRELDDPWAYLQATIASLGELPYGTHALICCDGEYEGPRFTGWEIVSMPRMPGAGNTAPTWRTWRAALERTAGVTPAPRVMFLEDDVLASRHALDRAFMLGVPADVALVKYFDAWRFNPASPRGLWRPPPASLLWNQALLFERGALEQIVAWAPGGDAPFHRAADNALADALEQLGMRYAVHVPCLFQHQGVASALTPGVELDNRKTTTWLGINFESMLLFKEHTANLNPYR